jgi:hypothetical protein
LLILGLPILLYNELKECKNIFLLGLVVNSGSESNHYFTFSFYAVGETVFVQANGMTGNVHNA